MVAQHQDGLPAEPLTLVPVVDLPAPVAPPAPAVSPAVEPHCDWCGVAARDVGGLTPVIDGNVRVYRCQRDLNEAFFGGRVLPLSCV